MADITAIILTLNEEDYIGECIESIKSIVKRIVVIDSFSEDKTVEIAKSYGAEVYQHEFVNHARQYMYGVEIADVKTAWIFKFDADERLTEESAKELASLCEKYENDESVSGIALRYYQKFLGKPLKHGGFYPWIKLCVYKTGMADMEDRNMDEHLVLKSGEMITAKKDSIHESFRNMDFFVKKRNWYSTKEAMDYFENRKVSKEDSSLKTRIKMGVYYKLPMGFRAWLFYVYSLYFRLGFLDGREGRMYAFFHAYWYRYLIDAKIYEHQLTGGDFREIGALNKE